MNRLPFLTCLAVAGLFPFNAGAQEDATATQVAAFNMNPLVVTSTLGVETVEESLSSVTVIDSEALENRNPQEMADVLRGQPGVNVVSNGSFGKSTSVFTRGTGSESTLLLLDGIRIRSASSGSAPWQYIPPQLLNRVEIVRGPRGSLYGSDAVGGVVQGFTRPRNDRGGYWVEAGGGSFATQEYGAGVSGDVDGTDYSIQGHYLNTDGTNIRPNGDDKGFRNGAGTLSVEHEFDNGASVGLVGLHSSGKTEYSGGEIDFMVDALGLKAATPVTTSWDTALKVSQARDHQDDQSSFGSSFFHTTSRTAHWKNTLSLGASELIAGAEYRIDELDSSTAFTEDSRFNRAVFAQFLTDFGSADLQLSGRWDDNEAFGEEVTGGLALGYELDSAHQLRASYGTAFRAPTFNDLYFPYTEYQSPGFVYRFEGNPDLDPETSETAELGARGSYGHVAWDIALFETQVDNLIANQMDSNGVERPTNVKEAVIRGIELSGTLKVGRLSLTPALTLQDPRNKRTDNRLPRRATRIFRLDAHYDLNDYRLGATVQAEGDRYESEMNTTKLPGFGTLDLRVAKDVTDALTLSMSVNNVFDRRYQTAENYLAAGRAVYATIRYGAQ